MHKVEIVPAESFQREAKPLVKKFQSLSQELRELSAQLHQNPRLGTPLGKSCYKIRLAVRSKGGGKSGGIRVVTYVVAHLQQQADGTTTVYLASIFDKSERDNITDAQLKSIIAAIDGTAQPTL